MVTPRELARRLRVDPKRLRAWLRSQAAAGHPLLGGHVHNGRWEFGEEEADQLAREFIGGAPAPRQAKSSTPSTEPARPVTDADGGPGHRVVEEWRGEELETLADLLRPGLRGVCVGINPSPVSVAAGHYYQGRLGQGFWRRLRDVGVIAEAATRHEDDDAFAAGFGFTDIVKRPTRRADGIPAAEFAHGRKLLEDKLTENSPDLLIFTFKKTATSLFGDFEGYGHRPELGLGEARVFVMPGPFERTDRVSAALADLRGLLG